MKVQHDEKDEVLHTCAECGKSVTHTALTDIVYSFITCDCDVWNFAHLVKVAWHKACFLSHEMKQEL